MNELDLKKEFELIIPEGFVEAYKQLEEAKVRFDVMNDMAKASVKEFLEKNNLTEYEQGDIKVSKTKDFTKKVVDTQKLKDEGLYEMFTKDSLVKGHVNITVKYEDE